jgi:cation transport regulator ChaC
LIAFGRLDIAAGVTTLWYFAYGSNMATSTLCGRREVSYRRALAARVPGWRLVLDKPPLLPVKTSFANIVADPEAEVLGVLYEVSAEDFDHIELTEGVRIGNYDRVEVRAWLLSRPDDPPLSAFSLTSGRRDQSLRPSERYMQLLVSGATEHGLPEDYVEYLRRIPAGPEDEETAKLRPLIDEGLRRLRRGER